jgi:hypothetical protein
MVFHGIHPQEPEPPSQQCLLHLAALPPEEELQPSEQSRAPAENFTRSPATRVMLDRFEPAAAAGGGVDGGWSTHQHVLQLMAGGLLASGVLVGGYFWARYCYILLPT